MQGRARRLNRVEAFYGVRIENGPERCEFLGRKVSLIGDEAGRSIEELLSAKF
jgi:hypothetical protein